MGRFGSSFLGGISGNTRYLHGLLERFGRWGSGLVTNSFLAVTPHRRDLLGLLFKGLRSCKRIRSSFVARNLPASVSRWLTGSAKVF